jgi:Xaa-Pro dipeptidase
VPGPNLAYVTHLSFFLSERPIMALLAADTPPCIVLPELEAGKVAEVGFRAYPYNDDDGYAMAFHEACAALELADARIGVEALRMRVLEARILERFAPQVELVPIDDLVSELRMRKGPGELEAMKRATRAAEKAFQSWVPTLRAGMSEREAASRLVSALLASGADGLAFDPIVASGPRGALPHAVPGDRRFQHGDWVVVDWGARVSGYVSDLTRSLVIGAASEPLLSIHAVVLEANAAGRAAVAPGVKAHEVDAAARRVVDAAGYGPRFFHRTGHGLGLEEHEPPYMVRGNCLVLEAGMTFTIEPGIYLEGIGGVRIEDDVVVTEDGSTTLSTLPRTPFVVSG